MSDECHVGSAERDTHECKPKIRIQQDKPRTAFNAENAEIAEQRTSSLRDTLGGAWSTLSFMSSSAFSAPSAFSALKEVIAALSSEIAFHADPSSARASRSTRSGSRSSMHLKWPRGHVRSKQGLHSMPVLSTAARS